MAYPLDSEWSLDPLEIGFRSCLSQFEARESWWSLKNILFGNHVELDRSELFVVMLDELTEDVRVTKLRGKTAIFLFKSVTTLSQNSIGIRYGTGPINSVSVDGNIW